MGKAPGKQGFRGNIRGFGVRISAAVHHIDLASGAQKQALTLTHIQHGKGHVCGQRLPPGGNQRGAKSQCAAASVQTRSALSRKQEQTQQHIYQHQPGHDIGTFRVHRRQRAGCQQPYHQQHIPDGNGHKKPDNARQPRGEAAAQTKNNQPPENRPDYPQNQKIREDSDQAHRSKVVSAQGKREHLRA